MRPNGEDIGEADDKNHNGNNEKRDDSFLDCDDLFDN